MKMKRRVFSRGLLAGAVGLLLLVPANPQGKKGEGGKTKYQFNFVFDGDFTLLQETAYDELGNPIPWTMESGAGGTGNLGGSGNLTENGKIPLMVAHIVQIGDFECCAEGCPETCSARLNGRDLEVPWVFFLPYDSDQGGYDVKLHFVFSVPSEDVNDPEYLYTVQSFGWTDSWEPTNEQFCAPIEFTTVRMWQYSPTLKHRQKQCSDYFAPCEADWTELNLFPGTFRAVIWREPEAGPSLPPPCGGS